MDAPKFSEVINSLPWYERAISAVAPGVGLRRLEARVQKHLFAYQAAQADRLYAPKTWGVPSENGGTARARAVMMWESLDLVENFPLAKAAIAKFGTFLTPTEYSPATGDRAYNTEVANFFHEWCKRADVTGRHSFRKLVQLGAEMRPAYGDCGYVLRRVNGELKIQLISGDRIGNPNENPTTDMEDGKQYFSGVIVDTYGRPVAYRVYRVATSGIYESFEDVPAEQFFHYFDPFRVDQYRGVPDFHAVARHARMLKDILEAELAGVQFASQNAALVFTERGQAAARNLFTPANAATLANGELPKHEQSQVANIKYLYSGDKVEVMPSRPGASFTGFVQEIKKEIAEGLGSYPAGVLFGTQDYKGPSVRAEFAQADRVNERHQGILCDKVCDPIKNAVILDAIARGELRAPARLEGESFAQSVVRATRGVFRFPPRLTIDVGRESQARLAELTNGANSLQELAAEDGKDAYSRLEQRAQEASWAKELAEKYQVPETTIMLPGGQLPSTPAAAAAVGENAAADAAQAQADASAGPNQPAAPTADAADPEQMAAPRSVRELLAGPGARRAARLDASAKRMGRLSQLRAAMGDKSRAAEAVKAALLKLN